MEELNKELKNIVKEIRKIKRIKGKCRKEYNNHFFKSLISQACGIGGIIRYETYGRECFESDFSLAKSCTSLEEWRKRFGEECGFPQYHSHDKKGNLDDKCECGYYYRKIGGDSFYLTLILEKQLQEIDTRLKQKEETYKSLLSKLKSCFV